MKAREAAVLLLDSGFPSRCRAHRCRKPVKTTMDSGDRSVVVCVGDSWRRVAPAPDGTPACAPCWPEEWAEDPAEEKRKDDA